MEGSFTCIGCMKAIESPLTCTPCGHTACSNCLKGKKCPECGPRSKVENLYKNVVLDNVSGKFVYSRQILSKLKLDVDRQSQLFTKLK